MKKAFYLITTLLFTTLSLSPLLLRGQCSPNAITQLDVNEVRATLPQGGALWWDFNDAGYIVPKDHPDEVAAIFAGGVWIAGLDPAANLKVSALGYGSPPPGSAGPLINGTSDENICEQFDRFWKVSRVAIDNHVQDFADNGIIDNPQNEILSWPGRGNPSSLPTNGFALPDVQLAPFTDLNGNGIYEPMNGEYPDVKGDEAVWWMYNTAGSNAFPLSPRINVGVTAYGFNQGEETLQMTTWYDMTFTNAGTESLDSTFVGLWMDADLGCYVDDYVGCLPDDDMSFVYNADAIDGDPNGCFGVPNYGDEVPVLGVKFLRGVYDDNGESLGMTSFIYYNNSGFGLPNPPPPPTTDPNIPVEVYNYLNGRWRDGTPITTGGDGYMTGGAVTNYVFHGAPSDNDAWSMCSENLEDYDRRTLMNSGPFSLSPGQSNHLSFAVIFLPDQVYPCPDLGPLHDACVLVQGLFDELVPAGEQFLPAEDLAILPNPFSDVFQVKVEGDLLIEGLEIRTVSGRLVQSFTDIHSATWTYAGRNLASGVYLVKAQLNNGMVAVGKVVSR